MARQLSALSQRLASKGRPGHVEYICKTDAANWATALAAQLKATIEVAGLSPLRGLGDGGDANHGLTPVAKCLRP